MRMLNDNTFPNFLCKTWVSLAKLESLYFAAATLSHLYPRLYLSLFSLCFSFLYSCSLCVEHDVRYWKYQERQKRCYLRLHVSHINPLIQIASVKCKLLSSCVLLALRENDVRPWEQPPRIRVLLPLHGESTEYTHHTNTDAVIVDSTRRNKWDFNH